MLERRIATNPSYNLFLNNMTKTVLLSQLVYWDKRKCLKKWGEVWFAKTSADLAEEICHPSAKSIGDWLREFRELGIIKTRRAFFAGINQLWIQVNHDRLDAILAEYHISPDELPCPADDNLSDSNLPETELTPSTNLPETDFSTPVTYPTGNCISEITLQRKSDQIDDDDVKLVSKYLSQIEISEITQRVLSQINSRKLTSSPIRNTKRYLQVSLENEANQVKAKKESTADQYTIPTTWEELAKYNRRKPEDLPPLLPKEPKPKNDEIWDATLIKMQEKWDETYFSTWFKDNWFMSKTEDKYIVAVPNSFLADMLQYRLYDEVKAALAEVAQRDLEIEFIVQRR